MLSSCDDDCQNVILFSTLHFHSWFSLFSTWHFYFLYILMLMMMTSTSIITLFLVVMAKKRAETVDLHYAILHFHSILRVLIFLYICMTFFIRHFIFILYLSIILISSCDDDCQNVILFSTLHFHSFSLWIFIIVDITFSFHLHFYLNDDDFNFDYHTFFSCHGKKKSWDSSWYSLHF